MSLRDEEDRTQEQLEKLIQFFTPTLEYHKVPAKSPTAYDIAKLLKIQEYRRDSIIFHKGSQPRLFYVILLGSILVYNDNIDESGSILPNGKQVATLQVGSGFGGLALASDEPQSNTCVCMEHCIIGTLSKEDYTKLMQPSHEPNPKEKYMILQQCDQLKWTAKHLLKELSLQAVTKVFKRGALILQQGTLNEDGVYFIKSGIVRQIRELPPQSTKEALLMPQCVFVDVEELSSGQAIGWEVLLSNLPTICSSIAKTTVIVYSINKLNLLHKLDNQSLTNIYEKISSFPCDLEIADRLALSEKWLHYRKRIFNEVKQSRAFKTQRIKAHDPGSLTTSFTLAPFPFDPTDTLDVQAGNDVDSEQDDTNTKSKSNKRKRKKKKQSNKSKTKTIDSTRDQKTAISTDRSSLPTTQEILQKHKKSQGWDKVRAMFANSDFEDKVTNALNREAVIETHISTTKVNKNTDKKHKIKVVRKQSKISVTSAEVVNNENQNITNQTQKIETNEIQIKPNNQKASSIFAPMIVNRMSVKIGASKAEPSGDGKKMNIISQAAAIDPSEDMSVISEDNSAKSLHNFQARLSKLSPKSIASPTQQAPQSARKFCEQRKIKKKKSRKKLITDEESAANDLVRQLARKKYKITVKPVWIPIRKKNNSDYKALPNSLKRSQTPRSFRIAKQRKKVSYTYHQERRQFNSVLKMPGYSWLTQDQQHKVSHEFRKERKKWLVLSNAEEDDKQRQNDLLFQNFKKERNYD